MMGTLTVESDRDRAWQEYLRRTGSAPLGTAERDAFNAGWDALEARLNDILDRSSR